MIDIKRIGLTEKEMASKYVFISHVLYLKLSWHCVHIPFASPLGFKLSVFEFGPAIFEFGIDLFELGILFLISLDLF